MFNRSEIAAMMQVIKEERVKQQQEARRARSGTGHSVGTGSKMLEDSTCSRNLNNEPLGVYSCVECACVCMCV